MREPIEGLRWIGPQLGEALFIDQFRADIRALCERYGEEEYRVGEIEYEHCDSGKPPRISFTVWLLDADGRFYVEEDVDQIAEETHTYDATGLPFPPWWIPFNGGLFTDHALTDVSASA